jgi:hypothetical protein
MFCARNEVLKQATVRCVSIFTRNYPLAHILLLPSALMGHRSLQMTLRYAQLYESTKRRQYDEAMERIALRQVALRR